VNIHQCSARLWRIIVNYKITQAIPPFWLVLAYDLLEDRRTIDVIITKFFPLCFKMAERFESLDRLQILQYWTKNKVQKSLARALNRNEKQEEERRSRFFFRKWLRRNTRAVSVVTLSSETKPRTKSALVSQEHVQLLYLKFNNANKQNVYEINLFKKFNFSQSQNNCCQTDWCQEWNIKTSLLKIS